MRNIIFVAITSCSILSSYAAPTTFPYENEVYVPPNLHAATPDYSYEESDPGGYHYALIWFLDLNTAEMPFCAMTTGCNQYTLVATYKLPPILPFDVFNCSANGLIFEEADFAGTVTGTSSQTICNVGECCAGYIGLSKFSDDQPEWHNWLNTLASTGLCGDLQTEAMYCAFTNGHMQGNCFTRYATPTERILTLPCPDSYYKYWLDSCPVYKNVPVNYGLQPEPPVYIADCDLEEAVLVELSTEENDHICHPWSYYFPDEAKNGSGSGSSDDDDDDSSATVAVALVGILLATVAQL
jgi:hypothetical protein